MNCGKDIHEGTAARPALPHIMIAKQSNAPEEHKSASGGRQYQLQIRESRI